MVMSYDAFEELVFRGWWQSQFTRVLDQMPNTKLLPCRGCGALVHSEQVVVSPYSVDDDTCPLCRWSEDIEGFMVPDRAHFQRKLRHWQKRLEDLGPFLELVGASKGIQYDPEFRPIQRKDFLMSDDRSQLMVDFGSDVETWFYWRSNYWHRNPRILHKKSYLRKLRRIVQDPVRRRTEFPKVPPCNRCGQSLEWYVRRSHELGFKCAGCKVLYLTGSSLFEGPPLADKDK